MLFDGVINGQNKAHKEKIMPRGSYFATNHVHLLYYSFPLASFPFLNRLFSWKISATSIGNPSKVLLLGETEAVMDPARECEGKGACELKEPKRFADQIMPHLLNLYGSCAKAKDFDMYAPDASFEDPLTHAQGVKQIKSAFYSLSKVFGESKIVEYHIQEIETTPGKKEIQIDNKQHYKFMGKDIAMISLIKLYVENGKIVRHEDWWDKKPLRNRDTVSFPLVGRAMEMGRRGLMLATHAMMSFGKDPGSH